jgi:hypothetical protein
MRNESLTGSIKNQAARTAMTHENPPARTPQTKVAIMIPNERNMNCMPVT